MIGRGLPRPPLPQVIDMPLLFETRFNRFTRPNVVVSCEPDVQVGPGAAQGLPVLCGAPCMLLPLRSTGSSRVLQTSD